MCLDDLIERQHRARDIRAYVKGLDLSFFYDRIKIMAGQQGRAAIDPSILVTLWLYATAEGICSARQLDRLCLRDHGLRWICGGVSVNYHTLADFRTLAGKFLDNLLSTSIAGMVHAGLLDPGVVAVDDMRVRASAGSGSFRSKSRRSKSRLAELNQKAQARVAELKQQLAQDPGGAVERKARRDLAQAEARAERTKAAQAAASEIEAERVASDVSARRKGKVRKKEARASTTDAQARVMKMADGGFRPAYNAEVKTHPGTGMVVGLDISTCGSDAGQLEDGVCEVEQRLGVRVERVLADGGFSSIAQTEALHKRGTEIFSPPRGSKGQPLPADAAPRKGDGPGVTALRQRMNEDGYKIYARRLPCKRPHADMCNRGPSQVLVRGLEKVKAAVLWHVTVYNFFSIRRITAAAA